MVALAVLSPDEQARVRELASRAEAADGVAPLSEQFLLDLRPESGALHLLRYAAATPPAADGAPATSLAGYAQLADPDDPASAAELVIDPDRRCTGVGSALLAELLALAPQARIWSHGDSPAAQAFAAARGLTPVRRLHVMTLELEGVELPPVRLPAGVHVRAFEPGRDEADWVATNAAAFASHPEQGRLTVADLRERMSQPWFDPAGLLLVVPDDPSPGDPPIAAYHWTKSEGGQARVVDWTDESSEGGRASVERWTEESSEERARDEGSARPQRARASRAIKQESSEERASEEGIPRPERAGSASRAIKHESREGGQARVVDWTDESSEERASEEGSPRPERAGSASRAIKHEVYVVGVHPAYQGRGLGAPVTLLGLHHLVSRGARSIHLYVDGDNAPAIAVYRRLGFAVTRTETMYAASG